MILPSIMIVFDRKIQVSKNFMEVCLMQIALFIWFTICFFVFPLGISRVGYYTEIFPIFPILIAGFNLYRKYLLFMSAYALAVVLIINGGVRDGAYTNNTYTSKQLSSSSK
ncbi:MAG: hypothetical protein ACXWFB_10545 [Nitrososphaeraceae archaeon]